MKEPLENFDYSDEPAFTGISKATAKDLADRYKNECQPLLTTRIPGQSMDARCIVFPIEDLKKMIWEIEQSVRDISTETALGIRMYYGKYPDIAAIKEQPDHPLHHDLANLPDDYSFHHTLFLVPTYKDENNVDIDFDPWEARESGELKKMDSTTPSSADSGSMTAQMNHGNISPPPFSAQDSDNTAQGLSF